MSLKTKAARSARKYQPCQHCHNKPGSRPRKLCVDCHADLSIRKQYPSRADSRDVLKVLPEHLRPLPQPTQVLPGTPEYLDVLRARHLAGEQLWHPDDAKRSDD